MIIVEVDTQSITLTKIVDELTVNETVTVRLKQDQFKIVAKTRSGYYVLVSEEQDLRV